MNRVWKPIQNFDFSRRKVPVELEIANRHILHRKPFKRECAIAFAKSRDPLGIVEKRGHDFHCFVESFAESPRIAEDFRHRADLIARDGQSGTHRERDHLTETLLPNRCNKGLEPGKLRRQVLIWDMAGKFKLRKTAFLLNARPEMREQGSIADDDDACFWPSFGNR